MVNAIVTKIEIRYSKPEKAVIKQDDGPATVKMDDGSKRPVGYFLYVILNGKFDVESLNFIKKQKRGEDNKNSYAPVINRKQTFMQHMLGSEESLGSTFKLVYDSDEDEK